MTQHNRGSGLIHTVKDGKGGRERANRTEREKHEYSFEFGIWIDCNDVSASKSICGDSEENDGDRGAWCGEAKGKSIKVVLKYKGRR